MPRGPATSKRQQGAANQRDTRHENGPVAPGKRIQKQKSNGHLNGHAKSPESNSSTPPLPSTPPATNGHARQSIPGDTGDFKMSAGNVRRTSVSANDESSGAEISLNHMPGSPAIIENHRKIDVGDVKNPSVHRDPINFMLTVLQSCPLRDTLAILIVLLQIPPTFLSIVHLLFATLTFVPPSTTSSGLSFTDILHGTLGTPSVATIFFIDIVVLLVWIFLWSPFQDVALDLAQAVIALTLGGGASGKESGGWNILWCVGVLGISSLARNGSGKHGGLRAMIGSSLGSPDPDDPMESSLPTGNKRHGFIRIVLAIHILTQGIVRTVREWYVRREKRDSASIGDPEAGKPTPDSSDSTLMPPSIDVDISASHANGGATLKRKKKQSAQVRIRQPLWAALASTKIVMIKEYETSHTAAESAGTNATDMNNLGNAPFNTEADRIWITNVQSDVVYFNTSYFPIHEAATENKRHDGVDMTKPFYVKVNDTIWHATQIHPVEDSTSSLAQETRWNAEIHGLAPTSNYECTFHSTQDDSVIFTTSVRTLHSLTTDPLISPGPQITGRPGSPNTTLKTSIAAAEARLAEERNRHKIQKREHQNAVGKLRKDINRLKASISSVGGDDEKNRQKALQCQMSMKHNEEATAGLELKMKEIEETPAEEARKYAKIKALIQSEREDHSRRLEELNKSKHDADRTLSAFRAELSSIQQKTESKKARVTQLISKHENLTDANAKGLDEVQRQEALRRDLRIRRDGIVNFYDGRLQAKLTEVNDGQAALVALNNAIDTLQQTIAQNEAAAAAAYMHSPSASNLNLAAGYGSEIINEGISSNYASPWNPAPVTSSMANFYSSAYQPMLGPMLSNSPHGSRTRVRSSSMLSNVSGFTQSDDGSGPTAGPGKGLTWEDAREDRKGSSGSGSGPGSGSGSKSGSVGDPRSPVPTPLKLSKG